MEHRETPFTLSRCKKRCTWIMKHNIETSAHGPRDHGVAIAETWTWQYAQAFLEGLGPLG